MCVSTCVMEFTSTPARHRSSTTPRCPSSAAQWRGVEPTVLDGPVRAPACRSCCTTSSWPSRAAKCSGVQPTCFAGGRNVSWPCLTVVPAGAVSPHESGTRTSDRTSPASHTASHLVAKVHGDLLTDEHRHLVHISRFCCGVQGIRVSPAAGGGQHEGADPSQAAAHSLPHLSSSSSPCRLSRLSSQGLSVPASVPRQRDPEVTPRRSCALYPVLVRCNTGVTWARVHDVPRRGHSAYSESRRICNDT